MTNRAARPLAALRLEVNRLHALLRGGDDRQDDLRTLHVGGADLERRAVGDGADGVERDFLALRDRELFNLDRVADLDKHLLAAGFEYSVCFHCLILVVLALSMRRTSTSKKAASSIAKPS